MTSPGSARFFRAGFGAALLSFILLVPQSVALGASAPCASKITSASVTFFSRALDRQTTYVAFVPEPLEAGRRYPVVYLLHGAYGSYLDWPTKAPMAEALGGRAMIVVTPDGGEFGWYVDSPKKVGSNYETFVTRDLIEEVDARFPTIAGREGRAIAGLSMGGHGALSLAARHPELYCSASSMSGILRLTNHPGKWQLDETLGKLPEALDFWREHSVYDLAERLRSADVTLCFDTGTSDTTGAVEDNRQVHERLQSLGIAHSYTEFPGAHSWQYWTFRVGPHLDFHAAEFARRAAKMK